MKKDTEAAFARFSKDIPTSNEDHLDTNLELEREYLLKYLSFLKGPWLAWFSSSIQVKFVISPIER